MGAAEDSSARSLDGEGLVIPLYITCQPRRRSLLERHGSSFRKLSCPLILSIWLLYLLTLIGHRLKAYAWTIWRRYV